MARIFGYTQLITGASLGSTTVNFVPLSRPVITGTGSTARCTVPKSETTTTDSTGYFTQDLVMGDYEVRILFFVLRISVPDDSASYNVSEITIDDVVYNPAEPLGVKYVLTALSAAALKSIPSKTTNESVLLMGAAAVGDGFGGVFAWIATPGVIPTTSNVDTTVPYYIPDDAATCDSADRGYWKKGF